MSLWSSVGINQVIIKLLSKRPLIYFFKELQCIIQMTKILMLSHSAISSMLVFTQRLKNKYLAQFVPNIHIFSKIVFSIDTNNQRTK